MLDVFKKLLTTRSKRGSVIARPLGRSNLQTKYRLPRRFTPRNDMIALTILTDNFEEFKTQAKQAEEFSDYVQIDVMDRQFVDSASFTEREEINSLNSPLKWELHLMVEHPLQELDKWKNVKNIFRVIFHIESKDDPNLVIEKIKKMGFTAGIAINPDTPLENLYKSLNKSLNSYIDLLLFMTVVPGKQGNPFRADVGEKISDFRCQISEMTRPHPAPPLKSGGNTPIVAVDGSVNEKTIQQIKSWGVDIFNVGSALTKAPDMKEAYKKLRLKIED